MKEEDRKYYESRLDMFSSQGWKDFVEDVRGMESATNDISSVQDEKTLHFRRGELSIMRWILGIEGMSRETFEQLKAEK